ncbi:MAG: hypothetical protein E5W82_10665 [Mesorhizobium sp.]|nr:MAG: hypothetical protein E5W82_10665 [Mesorhizobium sp.]
MSANRYPEREIFAYGRYIQCQILNWSEGPPPPYLICNPLDARYREEFVAHQAMGTWAKCDLRLLLDELTRSRAAEKRLREALTSCEAQLVAMYRVACPFGNTETGNNFADKDEAVRAARAALSGEKGNG